MDSGSVNARMSVLAYLYDNMQEFPQWLRALNPKQVEDLAEVMSQWLAEESKAVIPMEEIERRELLRALVIFRGDVIKTAKALKLGKTTVYRKLERWGYRTRRP